MKNLIKYYFNKGAENYDKYSFVQKEICNHLILMLSKYIKLNNISDNIQGLELGCGTGEFSKLLSNMLKFNKLHLIDISEKMINLAKKKNKKKNCSFEVCDFDNFSRFSKFNFIFSNMSLHWSKNFEKLLKRILNGLKVDSIFLISFLNSSSFSYFRFLESSNIQVINKLPSIQEFQNILDNKKFFIDENEFTINKTYPNALNFLRDLKKIGANGSLNKKKKKNLFSLRNKKDEISVNYTFNCMLLRRKR